MINKNPTYTEQRKQITEQVNKFNKSVFPQNIKNKVDQLTYEISLVKEELIAIDVDIMTGVMIRLEELNTLVNNGINNK